MGIDIRVEKVISFREAASYCPRRRRGRKPHVATFYRWSQQGLETIKIGGQLCTSVEALQRFFDWLTNKQPQCQQESTKVGNAPGEKRRQKQIESELATFGL